MISEASTADMPIERKHKPPFQWFGGKATVAKHVWQAIGDAHAYVEPFFGSGAVLLSVEAGNRRETVNDLDGYVANFWRAVQKYPDEVARHADWPCNETDLNSRHCWLSERKAEFSEMIWGDPEFCDPKFAGWWVWGLTWWIGGAWCDPGSGPWILRDGRMVKKDKGEQNGSRRRLPHLASDGQGVSRQRPHLGDEGKGQCELYTEHVYQQIKAISDRLRRVRVCSGDWARVCQPSVTGVVPSNKRRLCGVFLDPPYSHVVGRDSALYATEKSCTKDVESWCLENGSNPQYRIVLAGYESEYSLPGWRVIPWKANGGMANTSKKSTQGKENVNRERLWLSPHCCGADSESVSLWSEAG